MGKKERLEYVWRALLELDSADFQSMEARDSYYSAKTAMLAIIKSEMECEGWL